MREEEQQQSAVGDRWSVASQSATALAVGLGVSLAPQAQAFIIHTDVVPDAEVFTSGYMKPTSYSVDFKGGGTTLNSFTIEGSVAYSGYPLFSVSDDSGKAGISMAGGYATVFNGGDTIGASGFGSASDYAYLVKDGGGPWIARKDPGYIGVRFAADPLDPTSPNYFGWIELTMSASTPVALISGFAYEACGEAIVAGAKDDGETDCSGSKPLPPPVPVPGSLALMAIGAVPLLAYRRRRRT